jgi:hypothetical protein
MLKKNPSNLKIFVGHGKNCKNLIKVGPLIKPWGLEQKFKINKRRAYVYSGL